MGCQYVCQACGRRLTVPDELFAKKVRGRIVIEASATEEEIREQALGDEQVASWIEGKTIVKVIVVQGRIVNIVVK